MDPKTLNTLKYELDRWLHADEADRERHRAKLAACAAELVRQPADARQALLKKLVTELHVALGEHRVPASYVQLQRELERSGREPVRDVKAPLDPVAEARELLRGRVLVVIGGDPRRDHQENLRTTFELSDVVWPATRESRPSILALEPHIARTDVAAVLLLIRWIRHALNDVAELCERHDKALVRVPAGYNVNQIAQLVVEQRGRRLGG